MSEFTSMPYFPAFPFKFFGQLLVCPTAISTRCSSNVEQLSNALGKRLFLPNEHRVRSKKNKLCKWGFSRELPDKSNNDNSRNGAFEGAPNCPIQWMLSFWFSQLLWLWETIGFQDYCGAEERGMIREQVKTPQNLIIIFNYLSF